MKINNQLIEASKILGIHVLDHVIVTRKRYYSFRDAGLLVHTS
jgi:DNA repair protein RadC